MDYTTYSRGLTVRAVAAICALNAVGVVAFWPFDHLVIDSAHTLDRFFHWRLGVLIAQLALAGGVIAARRSTPLVKLVCIAGFAANAAICGWEYGGMDHDHDWFQIGYIVPYTTLALIVGLRERIAMTLGTAAVFAGSYAAADPEMLSRPYFVVSCSLFAFSIVISTLAGHILYLLLRRQHAHEAELEARVAARTAELRELTHHLQTTREQERARIASELHDKLGKIGEPDRTAPTIASLLAAMRGLVQELRPRALDELGLVAAARAHVESLTAKSQLAIALHVQPADLAVDAERATASFRVLQEALANVIKHAQAKHVEIVLALVGGELQLDVTDDGRGLGNGAGFGIVAMRERAEALGGRVKVTARDGGGTRVALRLPAP